MDAKLVREWKAGYDAHNKWVLEERRASTYQQRFQSLCQIWRQSQLLGFDKPTAIDLSVNDTWQELRSRYAEKHG